MSSASKLSDIFGDSSDEDSDDDVGSSSSSSRAAPAPATTKTKTVGFGTSAGPSGSSLIFSDDSDSDSDSESDGDPGADMSNLKPSTSKENRRSAARKKKETENQTRAAGAVVVDSGDSYDEESSDDSGDEEDKSFIVEDKDDKHGINESRHFKGKDEPPRRRKKKSSIDELLAGLKKPKRKKALDDAQIIQLRDYAQDFVNRMSNAVYEDQKAVKLGTIPTRKLTMLKEVESVMRKVDMIPYLREVNVCGEVCNWLKWGEDFTLPTLAVRSKLFQLMESFPVHEGDLKNGKIGKLFSFYSKHPEESEKNKALLRRILEKWANNHVFGRSHGFSQQQRAMQRKEKAKQRQMKKEEKLRKAEVKADAALALASVEGGSNSKDVGGQASNGEGGSGPKSIAAANDDPSGQAMPVQKIKARKRMRLDLDRSRDSKKRKKSEPILSGNQYARAIPEALSYDFTVAVATAPVDDKMRVRKSDKDKRKDDKISGKAQLKKMFGSKGSGRAQRAVNMSIEGRGMAH